MIVKCPHCNANIKLNFEQDYETQMYNFDGTKCTVEITTFCHECEEGFTAYADFTMVQNSEMKTYYFD